MSAPRPAEVCGQLLAALDASEGRRRRRKRDTTPDAIGLALKRELLEAVVREDPGADAFEGWLLGKTVAEGAGGSSGPRRAMALDILAEWRLAVASPAFREWLERGAPSEDARAGGDDRDHSGGGKRGTPAGWSGRRPG